MHPHCSRAKEFSPEMRRRKEKYSANRRKWDEQAKEIRIYLGTKLPARCRSFSPSLKTFGEKCRLT